MSVSDWLPILCDPSNRDPLELIRFENKASFPPFAGEEWGLLWSRRNRVLFPYCGPLVVFTRTSDGLEFLSEFQRHLDANPALRALGLLVGGETALSDHEGHGLFSADQITRYDAQLTETPFWRAIHDLTIRRWLKDLPPAPLDGPLIDLGCGTGRCAVDFAARGYRVLGVDLSYPMLAQIHDRKAKELEQSLFVLADAARLPIRSHAAAGIVAFGTLHHVASPRGMLEEACRVLKPGTFFNALDPHDSSVRFLFDAAMRLLPLWEEEAADEPLFSPAKIKALSRGLSMEWRFDPTIYLPPHLFHLLRSKPLIMKVIEMSDLIRFVPGLRSIGGLLAARGKRI